MSQNVAEFVWKRLNEWGLSRGLWLSRRRRRRFGRRARPARMWGRTKPVSHRDPDRPAVFTLSPLGPPRIMAGEPPRDLDGLGTIKVAMTYRLCSPPHILDGLFCRNCDHNAKG